MRTFIALSLPKNAIEMLCAVQDKLLESGSGGRIVPSENMHITLRFLGELDQAMTQKVCDLVREQYANTPAPLINMDGIGAFVQSGGDTVYAHLGGNFHEIVELQKSLTRSLQGMGIQPENRPFTPHITLLRNASFGNKLLNAHSEAFLCTSICVYSSNLAPSGATYTKLQECILPR